MKSYIIYNSPDIGSMHFAESALQDAISNGFDAELFDGVWKTDSKKFCEERGIVLNENWLLKSEWHKQNPKQQERLIEYSKSTGNMGCFASHFLLWEKCIASKEAICIFEYDVLIKRPLPDNILDKFDEAIEICRSPANDKPPYDKVMEDNEFKDFEVIDFPEPGFARGNSTGYILKPKGAKNLIGVSKEQGYLSLDTMLNRDWLDYKKLIPGIASKSIKYSVVAPKKQEYSKRIRNKLKRKKRQ